MARRKKEITAVPLFVEQQGGLLTDEPDITDDDRQRASDELLARSESLSGDYDENILDDVATDPLVVAAKSGDRRLLLEALRDRLAVALALCESGRDIAAMSRNLNIISKELDDIYAAESAATEAEDDTFSIENMRRYAQAVQHDDLGVADDDEDEEEDDSESDDS